MGLIYVNPEGPNGKPDPAGAARDIRETFARMAMNDEETVALIAGGHSFGKTHGAADAGHVGAEPEGATIEEQGLGWKNSYGNGSGAHAITSGLEGAWTTTPVKWSNNYLQNLFGFEWELTKSPAGANQWTPKNGAGAGTVPDAHDKSKKHAPFMLTTDLALKVDPIYAPIAKRFLDHPQELADAFARAWYKLTHRDMGPVARYLGPLVPKETLIWQDPVPAVGHALIGEQEIAALKAKILASGLSISELVSTAWASAATFRGSDKRGGANGARIRLEPQRNSGGEPACSTDEGAGEARNDPEGVQRRRQEGLAGRPDRAGRMCGGRGGGETRRPRAEDSLRAGADLCVANADRCALLRAARTGCRWVPQLSSQGAACVGRGVAGGPGAVVDALTAPEIRTVPIGGLRALNANFGQSKHGVFTDRPETLTNDFFVNLLDMNTSGRRPDPMACLKDGTVRRIRLSGPALRVDLVFGSNSQLRAIAEVYACDDSKDAFVKDFGAAWSKGDEPGSLRSCLSRVWVSQNWTPPSLAGLRSSTKSLSRSTCLVAFQN